MQVRFFGNSFLCFDTPECIINLDINQTKGFSIAVGDFDREEKKSLIDGCDMTRECLVKIERCMQHIQATQLQAKKKVLPTIYDALIDGIEE